MSIRDKYKGANLAAMNNRVAAAEEIVGSTGGGRVSFLKVDPGFNDFRVMPSSDETGDFMLLRHTHQLEVTVTKQDQSTEVKRKSIFNSKTHGGTPKDVIEEYIKFTEDRIKEELALKGLVQTAFDAELTTRMKPINDWKYGIGPSFRWIAYVLKLKFNQGKEMGAEFGRIDFAYTVGTKINTLAASFDRRGAVATVDPFSNPDTGGTLVIDYQKEAPPANKYTVSLDTNAQRPLTDDELSKLDEQPSLGEMLTLSYRRKDFNMALEGLQRFDIKHQYNTFGHDGFTAIVHEISAYYPEDEEIAMKQAGTIQAGNPFDHQSTPQGQQSINTVPPVQNQVAPAAGASPTSFQVNTPPVVPPVQAPPQQVVPPVQNTAPPVVPVQQAPVVSTPPAPPVQDERSQLIQYIQSKGLPIQVHPQHSVQQIRDFIAQEESLGAQQTPPPAQPQNPPAGGGADVVGGLF